MNDEFEERVARLERRVYANRCAIVALTGVLAMVATDDSVNEALISWGAGIPDKDTERFPGAYEEAKEFFVTLAAVAEDVRNKVTGRPGYSG